MIDDEDDDLDAEMDEMDEEEENYLFGEDENADLVDYEGENYDEALVDSDEEEEDYDDDEEDLEGSYEFDEEDERAEEEGRDRCMMCNLEGIKAQDRWNFRLKDDTGTEEPAWICRQCHGQFDSIEQFNKFVENIQFRRLYMKASQLLRMLAMDVPIELISKSVTSLSSVLFWTDEYGGSEKVRRLASEHLRDAAEKYLGDRKE